ncbi:hypothetical protein J6590_098641, partial [Homalodisca vitripennis]
CLQRVATDNHIIYGTVGFYSGNAPMFVHPGLRSMCITRLVIRYIHSARAIGEIDSARAATTGVAARGPSRSSPVLPLRARSLLIRRHSELSATDWDTGILARFIAPPSHPLNTRRAAPPVGARYGNAGWDTSSRRALKQTVHKTAQKLLTHESMGVKMLAARCGAGRVQHV